MLSMVGAMAAFAVGWQAWTWTVVHSGTRTTGRAQTAWNVEAQPLHGIALLLWAAGILLLVVIVRRSRGTSSGER